MTYDAYRDNCSLVGFHHREVQGEAPCRGLHEDHEMQVAGHRLRVCGGCAQTYAEGTRARVVLTHFLTEAEDA